MATCNTCGDQMPTTQSGTICMLCIAKIVSWNDYEYDDENDPAVKWARAELDRPVQPARNGCAVVALALMAVPAVLAAVGIGMANLIG
ncbi:hypothetical protein [Stackebrandtia soli]|uniref:hypothetical protein n=1 Tax=Stackebrandtia soli TaxID=1892856 RepID=UPI0039ECF9CF